MHLFVQQITKVQTAFISLFYIFINMKPWAHLNKWTIPLEATPTRAFNEFLYEFLRIFLISENSLKFEIRDFFCWGNEFSIYVRLSVCLSVKRMHCDRTEERSVQIFIPYERSFSLVSEKNGWWGRPLPEILGQLPPVGAKSPILNRYLLVAP